MPYLLDEDKRQMHCRPFTGCGFDPRLKKRASAVHLIQLSDADQAKVDALTSAQQERYHALREDPQRPRTHDMALREAREA